MISGETGGGGGFCKVSSVEPCAVRPRESVAVAVTVTAPGEVPAVFSVAVVPLPLTVPPLAIQLATVTGTPSGLLALQAIVAASPTANAEAISQQPMVGGLFGGSGFTVYFAHQT